MNDLVRALAYLSKFGAVHVPGTFQAWSQVYPGRGVLHSPSLQWRQEAYLRLQKVLGPKPSVTHMETLARFPPISKVGAGDWAISQGLYCLLSTR